LVSVHADERLDYALAATFRTERQLNDWLDGQAKAAVMAEGATLGFHRSSDLVVIEGELTPPGIAVFRHGVAAGRDADFVAAQGDLTRVSSGFPGYEGTSSSRRASRGSGRRSSGSAPSACWASG
jgi:antibiotic biosynthesis monooxygenase (ABM) superfamily enzyme